MTVFGVVCARFCTLTLQQFTPVRHTPTISRRSGSSERHLHTRVCLLGKLADLLGMLQNRHSNVAEAFLECLTVGAGPPSLVAAHSAREELSGVMGFEPPSWHVVLHGVPSIS